MFHSCSYPVKLFNWIKSVFSKRNVYSCQFLDWPLHHLLLGHKGRVNCLLYPNGIHPRYDAGLLVSGGRDFSVILWDIVKCDLLHRFCVHAGEITQILVPPNECSVSWLAQNEIIKIFDLYNSDINSIITAENPANSMQCGQRPFSGPTLT